ncbi:hypothetical protein FTX61_00095 [Nitriliruptoraceae bacterium ZYF776]|nr:hypothetical protein [Profundirhabdus halotolerans]
MSTSRAARGAAVALVAALAVGCGAGDDGPPAPTGAGTEDTEDAVLEHQLVFNQVGGIAGRDDWLRIDPDGSATLETMAPHDPVPIELDEAARAELARLVEEADLSSQPSELDEGPIADAITYYLDYGDLEVAVSGQDPDPAAAPLVTYLRDVVEEHRPPV